MNTTQSEKLFAEAKTLIPGGVNSPVRAFRGVGGVPRFIARGEEGQDEEVHERSAYGSVSPLMGAGSGRCLRTDA